MALLKVAVGAKNMSSVQFLWRNKDKIISGIFKYLNMLISRPLRVLLHSHEFVCKSRRYK